MVHQSKVSHKKVCRNHADIEDIRDDDNKVYYLASRKAMNRKHISHRDSKDERSRNTTDKNPEAIEESIKEAIIEVLGNSVVVTKIEVVVDTSGLVTSVVVDVVGDDEAVQSAVDTIESHSSKYDCGAGVLCRAAKVTLRTIGASPSFHPTTKPKAVLLLLAVVACVPRF